MAGSTLRAYWDVCQCHQALVLTNDNNPALEREEQHSQLGASSLRSVVRRPAPPFRAPVIAAMQVLDCLEPQDRVSLEQQDARSMVPRVPMSVHVHSSRDVSVL